MSSSSSSYHTPSSSFGSTYEEVILNDAGLQSFDGQIKASSESLVKALTSNKGPASITVKTAESIVEELSKANDAGAEIFKDYKEDIKRSKEMLELLEEYLNSQQALVEFCTALMSLNIDTRRRRVSLIYSIKYLCEDNGNFDSTLRELKDFEAGGENVFGREFNKLFESLQAKQLELLEGLRGRGKKLDKKLKRSALWRKNFFVVVGCAALATFIPSVGYPIPAPLNLPSLVESVVGDVAKDAVTGKEKGWQEQKTVVDRMEEKMIVSIMDGQEIGDLVTELKGKMERMKVVDREGLREVVDRIMKLGPSFIGEIDELDGVIRRALRNVSKARALVLERIV